MKFNNYEYLENKITLRKTKLMIKPLFIIILLNITKTISTENEILNKNSTTALIKDKLNPNNLAINKVNWEKLNSTMLNLITILDSLIDTTDKNNSDRDILALEFIKKNRELQSELKFLDRNKNFLSKRRKLNSFLNSKSVNENKNLNNNNEEEENKSMNKFNANIKIKNTFTNNNQMIKSEFDQSKENIYENQTEKENQNENENEGKNSNVFFIENKNTFSNSNNPSANINEFNLQIQFSNGIDKQKISQKNFFSNNINIENKLIEKNSFSKKVFNDENNYNNNNNLNSNSVNSNNYSYNNNNNNYNKNTASNEDLKSKQTEKKIVRKLINQKLFGFNYFEFLIKDKFRYAKNIQCSESNCASPNICLDESICKCGEEYANFQEAALAANFREKESNALASISKSSTPSVYCSYKRKKQIVTFMLEFFLFFGMGHVYSGNYIIGFSKFVFFVLLILFKLKSKKSQKEIEIEEEEEERCKRNQKINWMHMLILLLAVIWYLVDIIFLALSKYIDGNGVPMLSW